MASGSYGDTTVTVTQDSRDGIAFSVQIRGGSVTTARRAGWPQSGEGLAKFLAERINKTRHVRGAL